MKNKIKLLIRFEICCLLLTFLLFATTMNAQVKQSKDIPEGYSLIDGDILMPTAFIEAVLNNTLAPEATYRTNLWTNGIVRFEFDVNVTSANQSAMISAMAVLENTANVNFQQCAGNTCGSGNYVHIQNSNANNSQIGVIGGQQIINISSWGSQFIIVHELLHCLGFYHEQTRPDRNAFVQINCANVQGGCNGTIFNANFVIPGDASIYGIYDFDSLMHYGQCDFSIDCPAGATCACTNTVITVLAPNQSQQTLIGQRTHLSSLDKATVSFLYPFSDWRFFDCTYNGSSGNSDGTFQRPYTTTISALLNTPAGGTLWVLNNCLFPVGIYNQNIIIKTAPNVTATFGN